MAGVVNSTSVLVVTVIGCPVTKGVSNENLGSSASRQVAPSLFRQLIDEGLLLVGSRNEAPFEEGLHQSG